MKATYEDFLFANPNCSGFTDNPDAMAVFDFLNQDATIIKMIEYCEVGKPALAACFSEVEGLVDRLPQAQIDLSNRFTRTVIGRMIKAILEPFGYRPTAQKVFPKASGARHFTSASCYRLTGPATMRVVKTVEEIPRAAQ